MLGAVVAFRRGEHMRMTAFVAMAAPRVPAFLETVALVAGLIFLCSILDPAYEFARDEMFVRRPRSRSPMPGARRRCRSASR